MQEPEYRHSTAALADLLSSIFMQEELAKQLPITHVCVKDFLVLLDRLEAEGKQLTNYELAYIMFQALGRLEGTYSATA